MKRRLILKHLRILAATLASALGVAMAGPAAAADPQKVTLRLGWTISGMFSPFYAGKEKGFFKDAGIDLQILEGNGSGNMARTVGQGNDMFGYGDASSVVLAASKGVPIRVVANINRQSGIVIVSSADKPVKTLQDLKGRTVGFSPGDMMLALWPAVLATNNLKREDIRVSLVEPAAKMRLLQDGKIDAVGLYIATQVPALEAAGFKPYSLKFADIGINPIDYGIVTNLDMINKHPQLVSAMVQATIRSFDWAMQNKEEATKITAKLFPQVKESLLMRQLEVDTTLKALPGNKNLPTGVHPTEAWQRTLDLMVQTKMIDGPAKLENYYTDRFLPKR
jgi:NitT/TauT family transport system substrate-binding protein